MTVLLVDLFDAIHAFADDGASLYFDRDVDAARAAATRLNEAVEQGICDPPHGVRTPCHHPTGRGTRRSFLARDPSGALRPRVVPDRLTTAGSCLFDLPVVASPTICRSDSV